VHIGVWTNLGSGGGQRALYDQVNGLVARGHGVEVWAPPTADRAMLDVGALAPYHVVPFSKWPRRLADRLTPPFDLPTRIEAMKGHCRQVAREMSDAGCEIVFSATCQYFAAPPIARYASVPTVLYLQQPRRALYEALPDNPWQLEGGKEGRPTTGQRFSGVVGTELRRLQVREEVINANSFGVILVNSYFSMESVSRAYGLGSSVCYLGVDIDEWTPTELAGRRHGVIGIGTFQFPKRIELVIDAMALLPEPAPPLHWVGNGADPRYLSELEQRARAKRLDFRPHINVTHDQLLELLAQASVYCNAARLEPFGYGPLEAGAARLPVVAVAEGGLRETVVHDVNGLLAPSNAEPFAAALQSLLEDPTRRQRLGDAGRRLVEERWSLTAATSRLESALEGARHLQGLPNKRG
jgi:glycosyltransferase involved in cell wall biosynthesis